LSHVLDRLSPAQFRSMVSSSTWRHNCPITFYLQWDL